MAHAGGPDSPAHLALPRSLRLLLRGLIGRLWAEQSYELVSRAFITFQARGLIQPHETYNQEDAERGKQELVSISFRKVRDETT